MDKPNWSRYHLKLYNRKRRHDLQSRKVHGEGQAHRKEREEPCGQRNGAKGDDPVKYARDDLEEEGKQPPNPPSHG